MLFFGFILLKKVFLCKKSKESLKMFILLLFFQTKRAILYKELQK